MLFAACGTRLTLLITAGLFAPGIEKLPSGVLVECEEFKLGGKWRLKQDEYAGYSGRGYLVESASPGIAEFTPSGEAAVPRAGRYHVWVRAYLGGEPATAMHDRELAVQVNDKLLGPTHRGVSGDGFRWELCGDVRIGEVRSAQVRIHDRGRSPAVVDCVLLTGDRQFRPPGWTGNSRRPAQPVPFQPPPKAVVLEAKPHQLSKSPREHVEILSECGKYQVRMGGTLDEFNTAQYLDTYGSSKRLDCKFQPNRHVVIDNLGPSDVVNPRLVINGRRDWFSAEDILAGILKPGMNDAEKAMAIWRFASSIEVQCHENNRRVGPLYPERSSHPSRNTFQERANPVKAANCYYCSGCQLSASNCVVLLRQAGLTARAVWMCPQGQFENHCVVEAWHDGGWHLYDPEARSFHLQADNTTVASYETLHKQPELAARTHGGGFASPDRAKRSHPSGYQLYFPPPVMPVEQDWVSKMAVTLRPGEKFIWRWEDAGKFRCGQNPRNRDYPPYRLANGKLIYQPDLSKPGSRRRILSENNVKSALEDGKLPNFHPAVPGHVAYVSYKLTTPYPIVGGVIGGSFYRKSKDDRCKIYLSIADSDWHQIWSASETGDICRYFAVDSLMGFKTGPPRYTCYVKYEFSAGGATTDVGINAAYMELDLQMSAAALPSLSVGSNEVVYRDETEGPRNVRIVHGWKESSATQPPDPPARPVSPGDGAGVESESLTKLIWKAAKDPDGQPIAEYHVQVSPRKDMLHPVSPNFDRLTFSGKPEWEVPQGWLVRGRTYYWRLRSRDKWGAWSNWSDVWQFSIRP